MDSTLGRRAAYAVYRWRRARRGIRAAASWSVSFPLCQCAQL